LVVTSKLSIHQLELIIQALGKLATTSETNDLISYLESRKRLLKRKQVTQEKHKT